MNSYVIMLLEASFAMLFFYGVYYLWLRKETFFQLNRLYLLWAVLFSLIIPLINIPLNKNVNQIEVYNLIETISITAKSYEQSFISTITAWQWIAYLYLFGVLFSLIRFLVKLIRIRRIGRLNNSNIVKSLPSNIVFINDDMIPFSFLNRIYINPELYTDEQLNKIIAHETVHIQQLHTIDNIVYELLIILFWFNPIAYKYRNSAKELHEFLADEGVVRSGVSSISYQKLLFNQATGLGEIQLANSFNYSLIKRRLVMLTKIKSSKLARIRLLWVLPVVVSVLLVFACNEQETEVIDSSKKAEVGEMKIYDEVEEMPVYPGGIKELRVFIAENIKFPKEAVNEGVEGRVFVSFVVNEKGAVENVVIKRGVNEFLDAEAVRVVSAMPDWTPGKKDGKAVKVQFTIPISFKLDGQEAKDHTWISTIDKDGNEISEKVYFTVEDMPEYPGGDLALRKFIALSIIYPEVAKENGVNGRIFVQFIVNEQGKVVDVKHIVSKVDGKTINTVDEVTVISYGGEGKEQISAIKALQEEAIRVVSLQPEWKPGMKNGKPVKVQFTIPINFQLK